VEQDPKDAVDGPGPKDVDQVVEHVDDPVPETAQAATPPGGPVRFARMTGSSIAGRDAAVWVTDFLNAAYYRRPAGEREVDDLRLAFAILTTYWYRKERRRRLRVTDLGAFHKAYGRRRFDEKRSVRGELSRTQLLAGAAELLGDWFPDAYADDARRAWGIAFPSVEERDAYDPAARIALAKLGKLTPESAPLEDQTWHTYPPVEMPSVDGVVGALTRPETWPDYASELGRFTPLRAGGLAGQTFEIEVAAGAKPRAVPEGGEPVVGFDLTTHENHFMGAGHNRLILYTYDGRAWVRAAGTWDPMPWHVEQSYRRAGEAAQHAFWGQGEVVEQSMLHQLALGVA